MITLEVNGRSVRAEKDEMLLAALRRAGIRVPTLCHLDGLPASGACRLCVVEVEGRNGLVPSLAFPAADGMKVQTHSPRAIQARKTIVELLLANHPDDCLYCVRNGACRLQSLAEELGVRQRRYTGEKNRHFLDTSSASLRRDPAKCILCGKCVRVCEEVQAVAAIDFIGRGSRTEIGAAFDEGLNVSDCVNCGQCTVVCPTGALVENSHVQEVLDALADPRKYVVVQHAPAVSVTLGEAFGLPAGRDLDGALVAALRRLGFRRVFDTAFAADLTIMEEGSELVRRLQNGGKLPMLTSCSPGWIKFVETAYPDFIPNLSTCKSPQQMLGAIVKNFFAKREGIEPAAVFSVSVMPCTAKKFEARRPEMSAAGVADIDAVLTTRELARIIRLRGLDLKELDPETADTPFGERSSAGKLFAASGGVMEAVLCSAHFLLTGKELGELKIDAVRGLEGVKEARLTIDGRELGVAVAGGLRNAAKLLDQIRAGRGDLHFIEVMTCPGGCVGGGGQPLGADGDAIRARIEALYNIDDAESSRASHGNPAVQRLYAEFLGKPPRDLSHRLLHTRYTNREMTA